MRRYVYPDSLLIALHKGNVDTALLAHNIGGGRGDADTCEREYVLTSVLLMRRLTNESQSHTVSQKK